jgi:aldehyde:ferredoxin oxidoreductase
MCGRTGTGLKLTPEKVDEALKGVIDRDRKMNIDFGVEAGQDTLPKRFTHEPLKEGASKGQVVPVDRMVKEYYKIKGWDEEGVPPSEVR